MEPVELVHAALILEPAGIVRCLENAVRLVAGLLPELAHSARSASDGSACKCRKGSGHVYEYSQSQNRSELTTDYHAQVRRFHIAPLNDMERRGASLQNRPFGHALEGWASPILLQVIHRGLTEPQRSVLPLRERWVASVYGCSCGHTCADLPPPEVLRRRRHQRATTPRRHSLK